LRQDNLDHKLIHPKGSIFSPNMESK